MEVHWLQDLTDGGLDGECVGSGVYLCDSNMSASHSAPWTGQRSTGSARNLHPKQINKKRWCQLSSRWTQRFGGCHLWKFLLGISVILPYLILAAQRSVLKPGPDKSVACEVTFTDFTSLHHMVQSEGCPPRVWQRQSPELETESYTRRFSPELKPGNLNVGGLNFTVLKPEEPLEPQEGNKSQIRTKFLLKGAD